jgi:uncharacterized protein
MTGYHLPSIGRPFAPTVARGLALALVLGLVGFTAVAEPGAVDVPGQIIVSGHAEVTIAPTTAAFSIGVNTQAPTAAAAGEQNARLTKDVMAALERAGLTREEIKGTRVSVNRRWEYGTAGQRARTVAFEASNTIRIETHRLADVGVIIDAALAGGATSASDVSFRADRLDAARREALAQAVATARADAEALARAGGGSLGALLLLSTERGADFGGGAMNEMIVTASRAAAPPPVPTTIVAGDITVSASVTGRWRFVAPGGAR